MSFNILFYSDLSDLPELVDAHSSDTSKDEDDDFNDENSVDSSISDGDNNVSFCLFTFSNVMKQSLWFIIIINIFCIPVRESDVGSESSTDIVWLFFLFHIPQTQSHVAPVIINPHDTFLCLALLLSTSIP